MAELSRLRRLLAMAAQVIRDAIVPHDVGFVNTLREAAGMPLLLQVPSEDHAANVAPRQDHVKPGQHDARPGA